MNVELVTRQDLDDFKKELFDMLHKLAGKPGFGEQKWLKSYQVKNMLKISPGTLQNLRVNGILRFTKIGGIIYYKYEDILEVLEGKKNQEQASLRAARKN